MKTEWLQVFTDSCGFLCWVFCFTSGFLRLCVRSKVRSLFLLLLLLLLFFVLFFWLYCVFGFLLVACFAFLKWACMGLCKCIAGQFCVRRALLGAAFGICVLFLVCALSWWCCCCYDLRLRFSCVFCLFGFAYRLGVVGVSRNVMNIFLFHFFVDFEYCFRNFYLSFGLIYQ